MGKFILKRFLNMILVLLGVSVIVFLLLRLSSGDPAYIKLSTKIGRASCRERV